MAKTRIRGRFDVTISRGAANPAGSGHSGVEHQRLRKVFHGDLDGTSVGEMLSVGTPTEGSAGYVAIERFDGSLSGRKGSFALQHSGLMDRGKPSLTVRVVPDSGTAELSGLSGRMKIRIAENGTHFYEFEYELHRRPGTHGTAEV